VAAHICWFDIQYNRNETVDINYHKYYAVMKHTVRFVVRIWASIDITVFCYPNPTQPNLT